MGSLLPAGADTELSEGEVLNENIEALSGSFRAKWMSAMITDEEESDNLM